MGASTELSLKLMVLTGNGIGRLITVDKPELLAGRDPSSDIHIDDSRVSNRHARIIFSEGRYFIEDLGSSNGTYVNSQIVAKAELRENDLIKLGRTLLVFTTASDIQEVDIHSLGQAPAGVVSGRGEALPGQTTIEMDIPGAVATFQNAPPESDIGLTGFVEIHRKLSLLYEISRELNVLSSLNDFAELVLGIISKEIHVDRSAIILRDLETGDLEVCRAKMSAPLKTGGSSIQVSETIVNHALITRNAVLTEDAMGDRRFRDGESIVMTGVRSVMCVPLIVKDNVLGAVYVDRLSREKIFTRDDLAFLSAICNQAAVSIRNSQLFDEVGNANRQLTSLNVQLTESNDAYREANRKLEDSYKKLEETQQRLVQSEKLSSLGRLVAGIAHDLKNILGAVSGYAELIELSRDESKRDALMKKLNSATDICVTMVKDLLSFARGQKLRKQECDLNQLIRESSELATKRFEADRKLRLHMKLTETSAKINLDPHKMMRVFTNIITNGMLAMQDNGGEGVMTITTSIGKNSVEIAFADSGPGIPGENLARLFDPFFTTRKEGKGTGLGLSLCHGIVTGHGGDITVESEPGKGATFTVKLPLM